MTALNLPLSGSCRCGSVKLRITSAPLITAACHCLGCQKMTASAFSLSALFPANALEVAGHTTRGGLHGPDQRHHHCALCLSWVFTRFETMPDMVNIRASMFDDTSWFFPFLETSTDEAMPWVSIPALRSYPSLPYAADFPDLISEYAARAFFPEKET